MVAIHSILHQSSKPRVHPASLVEPATHKPALLDLLSIPPTSPHLINHLTHLVNSTVVFALQRPLTNPATAAFPAFVQNVLQRASATTPLVLSTMVYISRAKKHLSIAHEEWALERVFLGAVVCASKYLNDSCLKNHHWSTITQTFGSRDIGRIEREWYSVLDWEFSVSEDDLLQHHSALSPAIPITVPSSPVSPLTLSPTPAGPEKCTATPFEYGAFDILPSDVHSPSSTWSSDSSSSSSPSSSSSTRHSPYTPGTSPFSPSRDHDGVKSLSMQIELEEHEDVQMDDGAAFGVKDERRGRPTRSTKSAVGHRSPSPLRHASPRITRYARQSSSPYSPPHARHSSSPTSSKRSHTSRYGASTLSILKAFPLPLPLPKGPCVKMGMRPGRMGSRDIRVT